MPDSLPKIYATQSHQALKQSATIKSRTRQLIRNTTLTLLSSVTPKPKTNFLRCLYCHHVFDDQVADFHAALITLQQLGTFINTDSCIDMLEGKTDINDRLFHLSFDDGFKNILTNAAPVLNELNIPALNFIPSALMGADWRTTKIHCEKTTHFHGVIEMLDWSDLRTLQSMNIHTAAHTRNHVQLSAITDPNILKNEICGAKQDIENNLQVPCQYISWPYGKNNDISPQALTIIQQAGYRACFSAIRGTVIPRQTDIFQIPRHHIEPHWPINQVKYFALGNME